MTPRDSIEQSLNADFRLPLVDCDAYTLKRKGEEEAQMNVTTIPLTRIGCLALAAGTILFQCACSGGARHESTEVYDLVTANTHIAYWEEASAGLAAAAKDLGVRAETIGPDTYDPQAEKDALLKALHQNLKPAGFLVSAADPDLMRDAIDEAVAAGIPVITIDADSPKSKRQFFIGTNNYQAGQMGGEIVAKELNGKGNVVVFSLPAQANQDERLEGYKRAFARQPGIKVTQVVDVHGEPAKVFDMTRELTSKKDAPDAFVCLESQSCAEIADALDRANVRGKTIVAMDTIDNTLSWIQKGMIRATIAQKPYTMAYYGLRAIDDLHHNKPSSLDGNRSYVPMFMDTGVTVVDKSNVAAFQNKH
jgi:ribose transport system substrate-binding protein